MSRFLRLLLIFACALPLAAERRIAVIVDTSGSMNENDRSRYAAQISKILSDLAADEDHLAVIRIPPFSIADEAIARLRGGITENCSAPADSSLMVRLEGSQRATFKSAVDGLLQYRGPTFFGAPIHTALPFLGTDPKVQRLLLFVADAGGFGDCTSQYSQELQSFHNTGAMLSLVNIGPIDPKGGFSANPAFQFMSAVDNSAKLVGAVAKVYQNFLGSNRVQTGGLTNEIDVEIDPHVKEASLVIAAEGPLGDLSASGSNPHSDNVDLDFHGGGQTVGVDQRLRGYRIVRLTNPTAGKYVFHAPAAGGGGWMLIQDYSINLRMISQSSVPMGGSAVVQFEVIDEKTGKRITDGASLSDLKLDGTIGSQHFSVSNPPGGVFTVEHPVPEAGAAAIDVHLRGASLDRGYRNSLEIQPVQMRLASQTSPSASMNDPVSLKVKVESVDGRGTPPSRVFATVDSGPRIELQAGADRSYAGAWTPASPGSHKVRFETEGGAPIPPLEIEIQVAAPPPISGPGEFAFGTAAPIAFGKITAGGQADRTIQTTGGFAKREVELRITTDFQKKRSWLEIQTPDGWRRLSAVPLKVRVAGSDSLRWPVRVHAENCPEACAATDEHHVSFRADRTDGEQRLDVPIRVEVQPDPWYICWKRELAIAASLLLAAFIAYGIVSPSRFGRRAGVQLSPEEDLAQGFYYPLRSARGSGSGFYRDAHLYITDEFRLTANKRGAFARLRANKSTVRIRPENSRPLWRQQADGSWEAVSQHEAPIRPGVLYRNEQSTIFFEIRTK